MTQTTTAVSACGAVIEVDNTGGTPVNVSGAANKAELSLNRQIGSAFTFEGSSPVRVECKKDGTLKLTILYTTANDEGFDILADWYDSGGSRTVGIWPSGVNTGHRYFTGEYLVQDMNIPLDVSSPDPVMVTATLLPDGAINLANVP